MNKTISYPANFIINEDGSITVTFRDIPEAITEGKNYNNAIEMAKDALLTSLDFYSEKKLSFPKPSKPLDGEKLIAISI